MNVLAPFWFLLPLAAALLTTALLTKRYGAPDALGRYASIDGLRGYLAFFVFVHHGALWFFYARSGKWENQPSHLYTYFGQGSVALFFMITGLLFFTKLMDGRTKPVDWTRLFVSRVLRLAPLYFVVMGLMFLIVGYLSGWQLRQPLGELLKGVGHWLSFTVLGVLPDLNGVKRTASIVAGVTWSLAFEWLFYCALPVMGLLFRNRVPLPYVLLSAASVAVAIKYGFSRIHALAFVGGLAAAYASRVPAWRAWAARPVAGVGALALMAVAVVFFEEARGVPQVLLMSAAFAIVAGGNTLFGALARPVSRVLGEMAYSIYLLHGMVLFTVFTFGVGMGVAATLTPLQHWALITACAPLVVLVSFWSFRLIEHPAMLQVNAWTDRIKPWLARIGIRG